MLTKEFLHEECIVKRRTQKAVADSTGYSLSQVEYYMKKFGLIHQRSRHLYTCKVDPDSTMFWYFMGLYTADGYSMTRTKTISIRCCDRDIVETARTAVKYTGHIHTYSKGEGHQDAHSLDITDDVLYDWCSKVAASGRKSKEKKLVAPTNREHLLYYLRGYIDGDGCVKPDTHIEMFSLSNDFIQDLQDILSQYGCINTTISPRLLPSGEVGSTFYINDRSFVREVFSTTSKIGCKRKYSRVFPDEEGFVAY